MAALKVPTDRRVAEGVCPLTTKQIIDRVLLFSEEINDCKFYLYQRLFAKRLVESLLLNDGASITAMLARQSGKTEVVACVALALCLLLPVLNKAFPKDDRFVTFAKGVRVGIFAPSKHHSGIAYFRMKARVDSERFDTFLSDPELGTEKAHSRGDSFAFTNGSIVESHTASENVLNEGGTYHLMILDEAQKLSSTKINKELRPMLAAFNGTLAAIGTANVAGGEYHRQIRQNVEIEKKGGVRDHFQFDYEVCLRDRRAQYNRDGNKIHLAYEKFVAKELARVGGNKDDESFRMNFRLLWQQSVSMAFDMAKFKLLGQTTLEMNRHAPFGGRLIAGMDVAKSGDSTWLTIGWMDTNNPIAESTQGESAIYYRVTAIAWLVLQGNFEGDYGQYNAVTAFLRGYPGVDTLVIDSTGIGDAVAERFQVLLPSVKVVPFRYTTQSKDELYRHYLQEVTSGRFRYPAGPETQEDHTYQQFIYQHENCVKHYNGQYLSVFAAEEQYHDDAPDSAALMLHGSKGDVMPEVDMGSSTSSATTAPLVDVIQSGGGAGGGRYGRYARRY